MTTALITFVLVRIAVLNVFYSTGDMHDPGWLASVTWHNRWRLPGPAAFPGPFFSEHLALIFWVSNAISYITPLAKFDFYAAFIGVIHALYAAGVYRAWLLSESRTTAARVAVAVLVALAAAFSGVAVVALYLPHFEMAIPALGLWFVIALARRAYGWAGFWFLACLAVREDAGLHLFLLLILWAGVLAVRKSRDMKWVLAFALAALAYGVAAFLAKRVFFPAGDILYRSYLGDPPFHHVTLSFVLDRLRFYVEARGYVLLPLLMTLIWAGVVRNPLLPLGYIAAIPWLLFNVVAVHHTSGTLSYYYGFPFWLSLAWPLVALPLWKEISGTANRRWPYALLLLASLIGWQPNRVVIFPLERDRFGDSMFAWHDTLRDRAEYQVFVDYFLANQPEFGRVAFDQAVFGLLNDHADRASWLDPWQFSEPPETIIYFANSLETPLFVLPLLRTGAYHCIYGVPKTRILVATQTPLLDRLPSPTPMILLVESDNTAC